MLRWHAKVICGVIMFVMMPVCFLLPVKMVSLFRKWGSRGQNFIDLLSCFAGGVFLASYLIFMAPAVRVLIEQNLMVPYQIEYPLPDMIIGLGFFFMLAVNYIVRTINEQTNRRRNKKQRRVRHMSRSRYDSVRSDVVANELMSTVYHVDANGVDEEKGEGDDVLERTVAFDQRANGHTAAEVKMMKDPAAAAATGPPPTPSSAIDNKSLGFGDRYSNKCSSMVDVATAGMSTTRSIIMMLALSIDSVLEGMTIGLKQTVIEVWAIFIGIIVHESVIAFCLGLQLVRLNNRLMPVIVASLVYTIMNPLGLIVATAVYETCESDPRVDLTNGILQALTSGCFIYVIFYEILEGLINESAPLPRILAVFIGYIFLAAFAAIPGSGPYHYGTRSDAVENGVSYNLTNGTEH